jgi:hypothetical protein
MVSDNPLANQQRQERYIRKGNGETAWSYL